MTTSMKKAVIVQQPNACWHHTNPAKPGVRVTVESIEHLEGSGWKLRGTGNIQVRCHCPTCAMMFTAVQTIIPIECGSYSCPECGKTQDLEYKVQRIDAEGDEFSFQAEIVCPRCAKKRTFSKMLKEILKLKKIEIKLTGITLER